MKIINFIEWIGRFNFPARISHKRRKKKKSFEVIEKIEGYTKLNGKLYTRRENVFVVVFLLFLFNIKIF